MRAYTAVPIDAAYDYPKNPYGDSKVVLDTRTKEAVKDVQRDKWKDKTIVMVWEHKHIAHKDQAQSLRTSSVSRTRLTAGTTRISTISGS